MNITTHTFCQKRIISRPRLYFQCESSHSWYTRQGPERYNEQTPARQILGAFLTQPDYKLFYEPIVFLCANKKYLTLTSLNRSFLYSQSLLFHFTFQPHSVVSPLSHTIWLICEMLGYVYITCFALSAFHLLTLWCNPKVCVVQYLPHYVIPILIICT